MRRSYQLLIVFGTIAAMILLTGCGTSTTTGTTGLNTVTVAPTLRATNALTHTINTGKVTLYLNASSYQSKDMISVTLKNQSNQTIYFPDHLTDCSVILLLRLKVQPLASDNGQAAINSCKTAIVTRMHSLAAGQTLIIRLIAPSGGWVQGLYRATLSYSTSFERPTAIYSPAFSVGSIAPQP